MGLWFLTSWNQADRRAHFTVTNIAQGAAEKLNIFSLLSCLPFQHYQLLVKNCELRNSAYNAVIPTRSLLYWKFAISNLNLKRSKLKLWTWVGYLQKRAKAKKILNAIRQNWMKFLFNDVLYLCYDYRKLWTTIFYY